MMIPLILRQQFFSRRRTTNLKLSRTRTATTTPSTEHVRFLFQFCVAKTYLDLQGNNTFNRRFFSFSARKRYEYEIYYENMKICIIPLSIIYQHPTETLLADFLRSILTLQFKFASQILESLIRSHCS